MPTAYERRLAFRYLANAASGLRARDPDAVRLAAWVAENRRPLGLGGRARAASDRWLHLGRSDRLPEEDWPDLRGIIEEGRRDSRRARRDLTARRLGRLAEATGLSPADRDILEFLLRCQTQPVIEDLAHEVFGTRHQRSRPCNVKSATLHRFLGAPAGLVRGRFASDAPLVKSGLVAVERDGDASIVERLLRLDHVPDAEGSDVHRLLLDAARPGELEWSDFDHVAESRDHVERLLAGALRSGGAGVNVLVHGPPGTGKTEFCKTLAARLGAGLYAVGEADGEGGEPSRRERLQELRLAQRLVGSRRDALLLFDEMEDLLSDPGPDGGLFPPSLPPRPRARVDGSKVFMHRLLEQAPAPTLWTSNAARSTSPAVLRRMMFAVELRLPPPRVRARIWERQLARHGIAAGRDEARRLAEEFDATPGVATGATAAAELAGGGMDAVRRGVRALSRVLSAERPPRGIPERFDPALIRADQDPETLADRVAAAGGRPFSLCLQGPSGTGKSAFARHLADRLGLEAMQKRTSDLLSPWVGGTERLIAAAFAEARDEEAFLVFDEADSLLADRRRATRGWEVSQVNEMLTWMESHPLPFACTTNFVDHLDPATLRRFTFKVALAYLDPGRARAAFREYFSLEPPASVSALDALTPGDFAVVRRKADVLGLLGDPDGLAAMLRAECEAKPDRARRIGF